MKKAETRGLIINKDRIEEKVDSTMTPGLKVTPLENSTEIGALCGGIAAYITAGCLAFTQQNDPEAIAGATILGGFFMSWFGVPAGMLGGAIVHYAKDLFKKDSLDDYMPLKELTTPNNQYIN